MLFVTNKKHWHDLFCLSFTKAEVKLIIKVMLDHELSDSGN